jgi:LuxR family maltose regulon positive regulatory protein
MRIQHATARVYLAQSQGDAAKTIEHATHLVAVVPATDLGAVATSRALLALAHWAAGALDEAFDTFTTALDAMRQRGDILSAIRGIFVLGDIRATQGRFDEAQRLYESGLALAAGQASAGATETDELYIGLAAVALQRNELDQAAEWLQRVEQSRSNAQHAGARNRWCIAMAHVAIARVQLDEALQLLDEAEAHERPDPVPRTRPIAAIRARVAIRQGSFDVAERWAAEGGIANVESFDFLREYEHVTYARLLIARGVAGADSDVPREPLKEAAALLQKITDSALAGGRQSTAIESLILHAVVLDAQNQTRGATDALGRALTLAEPAGMIRVFVDEGRAVRELLRQPALRAGHATFIRRIQSSFPGDEAAPLATVRPVELLTKRELEILRLIAAGMRNEDIATHLFISPSTTKRHVANIYTKLDAHHRTEALNRAAELNLL